MGASSVTGQAPSSPFSVLRAWDLANRQRVMLTIHVRLNMRAWVNASRQLGRVIDMHPHESPVVLFEYCLTK